MSPWIPVEFREAALGPGLWGAVMREKLAPTMTTEAAKAAGYVPVSDRLNLRFERDLETAVMTFEEIETLFSAAVALRKDGSCEIWSKKRS